MASVGTQVEEGWERREPPPLYRFERKGDRLEGTLLSRGVIAVQDKPTIRYVARKRDGSEVVFLGTADIVGKLRPTDIGHDFRITYVGEDTMVTRNGNAMRVFEVEVRSKPTLKVREAGSDGDLEITDDDISF